MFELTRKSKISVQTKSTKLFNLLLQENPIIEQFLEKAKSEQEFNELLKIWTVEKLADSVVANEYYHNPQTRSQTFKKLSWQDYGLIRMMDYVNNAGRQLTDLNQKGIIVESNPTKWIWEKYYNQDVGLHPDFFDDTLHLFRQINGTLPWKRPGVKKVNRWMDKHPSGLDPEIIELRKQNKRRIIRLIIRKIEAGAISDKKFEFTNEQTEDQKISTVEKWWNNSLFHLRFAIRDPQMLNEFLDNSLSVQVLQVLNDAKEAGIPFFVNPHYLSLVNVNEPEFAKGADVAIRQYILYSRELVDEFGEIVAWEREDIVEAGKPNAAGWILPDNRSVHRRYPEVAILIPATSGRACGGLCSSCQRMYDFQNGYLNFNLNELHPKETWPEKLERMMEYFRTDSQLRDILITGGDAFMNTNSSLRKILDSVYRMAVAKKEDNINRKDGEKYAEMLRIRLGTRLPVYIPQRVDDDFVAILADFRNRAVAIGVKQFIVQTHFESVYEITEETRQAFIKLQKAGWTIRNQQVFTSGASRRGHTAKLRKVLNDIGVLTYYTFSVKGYQENKANFSTNARAVQEQIEEKYPGKIPFATEKSIGDLSDEPENIVANIKTIRKQNNLPFLATDRNVLNMPGVGKSMTFRCIGITKDGRRILEYDHDHNRPHSPIIHKMGKVTIIESKTIREYLNQMQEFGEDIREYKTIWGYSLSETELLQPIFNYPDYEFGTTDQMTNLVVD